MVSWMKIGALMGLLVLSGGFVEGEEMSVAKKKHTCKKDYQLCADGSKVYRNIEYDCEFDLCPEDEDGDDEDLDEEDDNNDDDGEEIDEEIVFVIPETTKVNTTSVPLLTNGQNATGHAPSNATQTVPPTTAQVILQNSTKQPLNLTNATTLKDVHVKTNSTLNETKSNVTVPATTIEAPKHADTTTAPVPATSSAKPTKSPKKTKLRPATTAQTAHPSATPAVSSAVPATHKENSTSPAGWTQVQEIPPQIDEAVNDAFVLYQDVETCASSGIEPIFLEQKEKQYHVLVQVECKQKKSTLLSGKFSLSFTKNNQSAFVLTSCGFHDHWGGLVNWLIVQVETGSSVCETPQQKEHFDAQPLQYAAERTSVSAAQDVVHGIVQDKTKLIGAAVAGGAIGTLLLVGLVSLLFRRKAKRNIPPPAATAEQLEQEKVPLSSKSPMPEAVEEGKFQ